MLGFSTEPGKEVLIQELMTCSLFEVLRSINPYHPKYCSYHPKFGPNPILMTCSLFEVHQERRQPMP